MPLRNYQYNRINADSAKGYRAFNKYPDFPTAPNQESARAISGRYVGGVPADTVFAAGQIIIASDVIKAKMCLTHLAMSLPGLDGAASVQPVIVRANDPQTPALRAANDAGKRASVYLELAGAAGADTAVDFSPANFLAKKGADNFGVSSAEYLLGHPFSEDVFLGFYVAAGHAGNEKVASDTSFNVVFGLDFQPNIYDL